MSKKVQKQSKMLKNVKISKKSTEKRLFQGTLSGSRPALRTKHEKTSFLFFFRRFFVNFSREITEKGLK